jgi:CMP-N,N'-diacetyllegionaminic acid synthase
LKTLGIIPGRKGSHRFPQKHHTQLLGKPMFAYTIEAALRARQLDRLVVSSDDRELGEMASRYDVEFLERPADLASDSAPLDDALRHVCWTLEQRDGFLPDVVVGMQGNVPVRKDGQIDEVVDRLERVPEATSVCTAQMQRFRPEWAKVISNEQTGECVPYMSADRGFRAQDYDPIYVMDGAIYGVRTTTLRAAANNGATHAWFGSRIHLIVQDEPMYALEVDYPDQAVLAECYLRLLADRAAEGSCLR